MGLPGEVVAELEASRGGAAGRRMAARLAQAVEAYGADRFEEASRLLAPLVRGAPDAASARELYGLSLYRQGRWRPAIRQLESFTRITGSFDQYPVLADCHRALGEGDRVEALWDELRRASPEADVLAEGRLVTAGARADGGDLAGAIALLARAGASVRHPAWRHLRQWYALADLYERAGELARARQLFERVERHAPGDTDSRDRLAGLG